MNGLLIATMVLGGSGAIAMQNPEMSTKVNETGSKVMYQVKKMFNGNSVESLRENGFIYPNEEVLSTLTEDQAFEIISTIDQINATYDWVNMTDDEITDALQLVKDEMSALYSELGIEAPMNQTRTRTRNRKGENRNKV